ncbi:putative helicase MOV-10 isoform X1 [Drosophila novamexicana]|uniref:putative helicase MOV-10 isoform X1 n=1 Tax=Drosophila novamexicana TaxID=47314 RepID=UPI0011E5BA4D|nr:putative helicase MOV-10 isoform X1 [Drosophila novamexicana]
MNANELTRESNSMDLRTCGKAIHQVKANVRVRKKFSDDEEDSPTSDDEEEMQKKKFIAVMRTLPHYEPSQTLLQALDVEFTNESLAKHDTTFGTYLQTQLLDSENVCSVLSILLSIEDVSTMQLYAQLMQPNVLLKKVQKHCFSFVLGKTQINPEEVLAPYLDEAVLIPKASLDAAPLPKQPILALLPHTHETLPRKDPRRRYVASLEQVTRTSIHLKFKRGGFPAGESALAQRYHVILRSRRTPFRFMYRAMQLLQENPQLRRYLFPIQGLQTVTPKVIKLPNVTLFNQSIASNMEQLQAVQHIVNGPSSLAPYIVFGPPGTGKTTTIVEAILQLRLRQPRSRILVTAGSNSACDTIALRICEYFASNERLQAVLVERAKESRLVTEDVELDHQLMRLFSRSVYAKGLNSVDPLLLKHSNCRKRVYEHSNVNRLRKHGIIVATLCTVGRLVTLNLGKFNFFTHIFIDEAGASTEPESLIGIMGIKHQDACHVILSGDHKQLGAVIKNNRAALLGLRHSLMERLLRCELYAVDANGNYDHTLQTRLRRNYRSHPEIVGLYNKLYYNDELIPQAPPEQVNLAANWRMLPNTEFPIIFQATHGVTTRDDHSTSSYNMLEAQVLCWYVKHLLSNGLGGGIRVQQKDIGVVAPYAAQCNFINQLLRRQGHYNVEVGSVENYQGREKNVIIATLVRSFASIGFMRNPRRLNVLISRAKSLMILIGNPVTLRYHPDMRYIINQCKLHGNYLFKKKDGLQRPEFLNDFVEEEVEGNEDELDNEMKVWYAKMPQDIPVAFSKCPQQAAVITVFSTDDSSSGSNSETTESLSDSSSSCDSSSSANCQCTPPPNEALDSHMAKLSLGSPEKIVIRTNFLKACAACALETTKQKLLQLQNRFRGACKVS